MSWDEDKTQLAAANATRLSELLGQDDFCKEAALRWLKQEHINKFLDVLDSTEASKIKQFAYGWHYGDHHNSNGFPLLDSLRDIESEYGKNFIVRLAEFEPDWISRWWKWLSRSGFKSKDTPLNKVLIRALTQGDITNHSSDLSDEVFSKIIQRRADLLDGVPRERWGKVLRMALDESDDLLDLLEPPFCSAIPSDASAIINLILGLEKETDSHDLLDELVQKWEGFPGTDPVARMMAEGHVRLDAVFRSFWHVSRNPITKKNDKDLWTDDLGYNAPRHAIAAAVRAVPDCLKLELGFSIGRRIAQEGKVTSITEVSNWLNKLGIEPSTALVDAIFPMVELWATLRTLATYEADSWKHKTELVGLRAKIASLATSSPHLWARALPWILIRASAFGDVAHAITLELAATNFDVRHALENARSDEIESVRLKAHGLLSLLDGLENPESGLAGTLADAAAHYMDGTPVFPHPLAPLSATWLGSASVESMLASGVKRACDRFANEVRDQGGDVEEALTKALLKEIEVEFRAVQPRLKMLASNSSRSPVPILSIQQRPASKKAEEPVYGCDIAWILDANVQGRYRSTWVDLVQVKKTTSLQRGHSKRFRADSWSIDCKQLITILKWSATAVYWLIASAGEVLVIPARHLEAIRCGTEKPTSAKTFSVGYYEIRSAAIPLEQYLVDLLIGQWLGTSSDEVVQFARGDNSNIRPRTIIEVTITAGKENG